MQPQQEKAVLPTGRLLAAPPVTRVAALGLACIVALAGTLLISFFPHWYEVVIFSNGMPQTTVSAFGPLAFFLVLVLVGGVNPLLRRWVPSLAFGGRELWLILTLWILAGVICYTQLTTPALQTAGDALNPALEQPMIKRVQFPAFLNPSLFLPPDAAKEYYYGKGDGLSRIPWRDVPWKLWVRPLLFWIPALFGALILSMSLVRMVHRQWSKHELLSYPIADVAHALLRQDPDRAFPAIFYNKIFWMGFGFITLLYTANGLHLWFPNMIEVPLGWAQYDLLKQFPFLAKYCGKEAYSLFRGTVYPVIVCIAVLLPGEVSLTCWLGWVLMVLATGFYFLSTGEVIGVNETSQIQTGMAAAMLGAILFIGRREYAALLRWTVRWRRPDDLQLRQAVNASRLFAVVFVIMTGLLVFAGLDWLVALVVVGIFSLSVILIARMTAEIGLPNFGGFGQALPLKILGAAALGPYILAPLALLGAAFGADATVSIAAQATTCDKLEELQVGTQRRGGLRCVIILGVLVAMLATIVATLWDNYSYGARREQGLVAGLKSTMEQASTEINQLQSEGVAATATATHGLAKLTLLKSQPHFWRFFLYGALAIAICATLRLRFSRWPFHPLPLLLFGSWTLSRLYFSFLIGWLIKIALVKIAGGKVFAEAKPFFIGAIAGLIAVTTVWIFIGAAYYVRTGIQPPSINFFF